MMDWLDHARTVVIVAAVFWSSVVYFSFHLAYCTLGFMCVQAIETETTEGIPMAWWRWWSRPRRRLLEKKNRWNSCHRHVDFVMLSCQAPKTFRMASVGWENRQRSLLWTPLERGSSSPAVRTVDNEYAPIFQAVIMQFVLFFHLQKSNRDKMAAHAAGFDIIHSCLCT